jgi:hypothetical protein
VVVPTLAREMCGKHVLTMEWIEGDKLMPGAVVDQEDLPLLRCAPKQRNATTTRDCNKGPCCRV